MFTPGQIFTGIMQSKHHWAALNCFGGSVLVE